MGSFYFVPGGGGAFFTTCVEDEAGLITALTTDAGDTVIKAGTYTIDLATMGARNTAPRRFVGVDKNNVTINIEDSVGGNSFDFSASLTQTEGVEFENISFVNTGPNGLLALVVGAYALKGCFFDINSLAIFGVTSSSNIVNCSVDMSAGASPFGGGFFLCNYLDSCSVVNAVAGAFETCEDAVNCKATYVATLAVIADNSAFKNCDRLSNCEADYTATTTSGAAHSAFFNGTELSSCFAFGPTGGGTANLIGFSGCAIMSACRAQEFEQNFALCGQMSGTRSNDADVNGYDGCFEMSGFRSDGDTGPVNLCQQISGGYVLNGTGIGFDNCLRMAAVTADTCSGDGFNACLDVSSGFSIANGGNGFTASQNLSSVRTSGNTGFGYASNDRVACALGAGDIAGLTDTLNTAVEPVTAAGI